MKKKRAAPRFLPRPLSVKEFLRHTWSVEALRPTSCPSCDAPARLGSRIQLYGHGTRTRLALGPMSLGDAPSLTSLRLRRYRCRLCTAVLTVGPATLLHRFLYTATAVVTALSLWAVEGVSVANLRPLVSPYSSWSASRPRSWRSLVRWAQRSRAGSLWVRVSATEEPERRMAARRVVEQLRGLGPPLLNPVERLHHGVVQAGCDRMV